MDTGLPAVFIALLGVRERLDARPRPRLRAEPIDLPSSAAKGAP